MARAAPPGEASPQTLSTTDEREWTSVGRSSSVFIGGYPWFSGLRNVTCSPHVSLVQDSSLVAGTFRLGNFPRGESSPCCMKAFAAAVFALLGGLLWGQPEPSPGGPVVELPKFVVTDTRELPPPEQWRYATIPGFEILSNASDKATQRLIRDFDMFRQALGHVWPQPGRHPHTTSLILCARRNKFDSFIPAGRYVPEAGFASVFLKQGHRTAIVIDLQATTLNVLNLDGFDDAATGTDSGQISVDHDKQLYREYVRYLLSRSEPRLPAWVEEGLSQIIMRMEFDKRWIVFAKLEDPNTISAQAAMVQQLNALGAGEEGAEALALPGAPAEDRDFNAALQRKALVPLEKFFAVEHDSPEATNVLGNNRWAKQAYAFVHMCLYGLNGKYQKQFATFLQRLAKEPPSEDLFRQVFGRTYKQMLLELRGYIDFTVYQHREYRAKEDVIIPPPPLELRDATQSEVGRIKGEAMVLAGRVREARAELIAPYTRGERDPYLLAALGLYERAHGEEARARKFLEAAFAAKAKRSDAWVELARYRLADALAKPAAGAQLSREQTAHVLAPLQFAHGKPPILPAIYDVAGDVWARSSAVPSKDDAKLMIEGALLFPQRLKTVFQASILARDTGDLRSAHALADHGLRYAPDAGARQRFEALKASIPPAPPEPGSVAPAGAGTPAPADSPRRAAPKAKKK